jgi:cell division protease FtsH
MSDQLGPISYGTDSATRELAFMQPEREYSEKTAEAIDIEVKQIMGDAYQNARDLIEANRDRLERIARALLKYETLDAEDVKHILDGGELDKPTVGLLAAEQAKRGHTEDGGKNDGKKEEKRPVN